MRLSLALLLSGSLLIVGCGGDDSATSSGATTEKEWAGKVTDVCRKSEDAARKAAAEGERKGLGQQELIAYVLDESVPIQKDRVEDLDAIEAPEGIQGDYDQFVGRLREGRPLSSSSPTPCARTSATRSSRPSSRSSARTRARSPRSTA